MPQLPPFEESFDAFLASLGVQLDELFELPTPSQTGISMLRADLRAAYRLAYAYAKGTRAAAALPDWPALIAQEGDNLTPEITAERMKQHFDAFFADVSTTSHPDTTRPICTPQVQSPERSVGPETVADGSSPSGSTPSASAANGPCSPSSELSSSSCGSRTPALSNAARLAMRGGKTGLSITWTYLGLYRWADGLSAEQPVSFEDIKREKASKKDSDAKTASKYPDLRERWECKRCGRLRHEVVGHTTNLTKHAKSCSPSQNS
ncbi:hypothetical protein OC835_000558 [Tilletia horrida]|nr:hypothetical protein OC835_000558 [Tilletia horrida]